MPNAYFNSQVSPYPLKGGKGIGTYAEGDRDPPVPTIKTKPGFKTSAPGKKQKDRSGGVKRAPVYPDSDGL